jgi:hypothetical protein
VVRGEFVPGQQQVARAYEGLRKARLLEQDSADPMALIMRPTLPAFSTITCKAQNLAKVGGACDAFFLAIALISGWSGTDLELGYRACSASLRWTSAKACGSIRSPCRS